MMNLSSSDFAEQCSGDSIIDLRFASTEEIAAMFYTQADRYIICVCFTLLFVIGFIGNGTFLLVVALIDQMRTKTNFYLANLAITDIIFIAAEVYENFITFLLSPEVKTLAYYTPVGCGAMFTAIYGSHFTSVALMILVALERYLAICKPLKHRLIVAKSPTVKFVALAWSFGLVYAVSFVSPQFFVVQEACIVWPDEERYRNLPTLTINCVPVHPAYSGFPHFVQAFPYIFALIVCIFMYAQIIKQLSTRMPQAESTDKSVIEFEKKAKRLRGQVARLLIANAVVFFVCHFPHFFLRFNDALLIFTHNRVGFMLSKKMWYILYWVTRAMGTANSVVNPLVYSLTNLSYRRAFWKVLTCQWNHKTESNSSFFTISSKI